MTERQADEIIELLRDIKSSLDDVRSDVSSIQSDVGSINLNTSDVEGKLDNIVSAIEATI
jgi:uncharacterized protein YoxC